MALTGLVSSSSVSNTILRPPRPRALTQPWIPATSSVAAEAKAPDSDATTPILKSSCAAAGRSHSPNRRPAVRHATRKLLCIEHSPRLFRRRSAAQYCQLLGADPLLNGEMAALAAE